MSRERGFTRRDFLKTAAVAAGLTCGMSRAAGGGSESGRPGKRPNVIYMLADPLRYQSLGYAGDANRPDTLTMYWPPTFTAFFFMTRFLSSCCGSLRAAACRMASWRAAILAARRAARSCLCFSVNMVRSYFAGGVCRLPRLVQWTVSPSPCQTKLSTLRCPPCVPAGASR